MPTASRLLSAALLAAVFALAPGAPTHAAPAPARAVLSTVPADLPAELLGEAVHATVTVRARIGRAGLVDSTHAVDGDPRLRASAEAAVAWWVFAPGAAREWVTVRVPIAADADADGLHPDVLAMARDAEAAGDWSGALQALVGALGRQGTSPLVANEWTIRERALRAALRLPAPPALSGDTWGAGQGARSQQLRTVARADHAVLVQGFDRALESAPWWAEVYLWRAGSLAGCGRGTDALRSLRAYTLGSPDTEGVRFANGLIERLAAADTLGVSEAIKTWRVTVSPEDR